MSILFYLFFSCALAGVRWTLQGVIAGYSRPLLNVVPVKRSLLSPAARQNGKMRCAKEEEQYQQEEEEQRA
jgi:hypothetical protein